MFTRIAACLSLALLTQASFATVPPPPQKSAAETAQAEQEAKAANERELASMRGAVLPVYLKLRESSAPRDWMLASQLWPLDENDPLSGHVARAELLRNAVAAAPDDVIVQWVGMTARPGGSGGGCSAPAQLPANMDNVLRLEGDNGIAWLPVLQQAYRDKDALGVDSALSRMAAATRFDDHANDHAQILVALYEQNPQMVAALSDGATTAGLDANFDMAMTVASSAAPSLYLLDTVCERDQQPAVEPRRFSICTDIARQLVAHGKNFGLREQGRSLLRKLGEVDPKGDESKREMAYLVWAMGHASDQAQLGAIVRDEWLRTGDDVQTARAVVRALGLPLTPPAVWQMPAEFSPTFDSADFEHALDETEEDETNEDDAPAIETEPD